MIELKDGRSRYPWKIKPHPASPARRSVVYDEARVQSRSPMAAGHPTTEAIRDHYDGLSLYYRALWGEHIHHGYWEGDESPAEAQQKLVERLAARAGIPRGARVLDVGCGLGGSSLWLARQLGCEVVGITISPKQAAMAAKRARREGLTGRVRFEVTDANQLDPPARGFDAVWVIEASEHLADKRRFIHECARALKPGGALAMCAWLAADDRSSPERERLVEVVCRGMLCPSLASSREYGMWLRESGFEQVKAEDITRHVAKTWSLCTAIAARPEIQALLRLTDQPTREFVAAFAGIREAYATGAMCYGMFTARKPSGGPRIEG